MAKYFKRELNESRPIQYAGFGNGGHTWVLDGYDSNNFFHMNWGWGGSQDGYFNLNSLNPGAGGIGGAGYVYNNNQQAIIGLQPLNLPQNFDLTMFTDLSVSQSSYFFGNSISVTSEIQNNGSGIFIGEFSAAIFNSQGTFIDFLSPPQIINIPTGFYVTNTFTNAGGPPFIPGEYSVAIFYRVDGGSWTIVSDEIGIIFDEINLAQFEVNYNAPIETNSVFSINSNNGILYQGLNANINVNLVNTGASTFFGDYRLSLANMDGSFAQNIGVISENNGLQNNFTYTNGINFSGNITLEPGTYLLLLGYRPSGSNDWFYAGSTNFQNPIFVNVLAQPFQPDIYENNNDLQNSFTFSPSFTNNLISLSTNSSNFHTGTDNDFYKIQLPSGYDYNINARLQDSFDNNNGLIYSADALFSYSIDNGLTWSEPFDTTIDNEIILQNGGNIIFHVAPYFSGFMGTYLLDIELNRQLLNLDDFDKNNAISLYPNPASDFVSVNLSSYSDIVNEIKIINVQGQIIKEIKNINEVIVKIHLEGFSESLYFIQIVSDRGISTKKLIINK